jgi:predicted nucleotidyltransferase
MMSVDAASVAAPVTSVLAPRTEVLEAYLFGSIARGQRQPHSDVDVAVYIDMGLLSAPVIDFQADLTADLMQALRTNAVDVVILNEAPPLLYHRVLRDGIRLLSRDLKRTTVRESQAMSRYFDYLPHLAKIERAASARIRREDFGR